MPLATRWTSWRTSRAAPATSDPRDGDLPLRVHQPLGRARARRQARALPLVPDRARRAPLGHLRRRRAAEPRATRGATRDDPGVAARAPLGEDDHTQRRRRLRHRLLTDEQAVDRDEAMTGSEGSNDGEGTTPLLCG